MAETVTSITKAAKLPEGKALMLRGFRSVISDTFLILLNEKPWKENHYFHSQQYPSLEPFQGTDKMEVYFWNALSC